MGEDARQRHDLVLANGSVRVGSHLMWTEEYVLGATCTFCDALVRMLRSMDVKWMMETRRWSLAHLCDKFHGSSSKPFFL